MAHCQVFAHCQAFQIPRGDRCEVLELQDGIELALSINDRAFKFWFACIANMFVTLITLAQCVANSACAGGDRRFLVPRQRGDSAFPASPVGSGPALVGVKDDRQICQCAQHVVQVCRKPSAVVRPDIAQGQGALLRFAVFFAVLLVLG